MRERAVRLYIGPNRSDRACHPRDPGIYREVLRHRGRFTLATVLSRVVLADCADAMFPFERAIPRSGLVFTARPADLMCVLDRSKSAAAPPISRSTRQTPNSRRCPARSILTTCAREESRLEPLQQQGLLPVEPRPSLAAIEESVLAMLGEADSWRDLWRKTNPGKRRPVCTRAKLPPCSDEQPSHSVVICVGQQTLRKLKRAGRVKIANAPHEARRYLSTASEVGEDV